MLLTYSCKAPLAAHSHICTHIVLCNIQNFNIELFKSTVVLVFTMLCYFNP